MSLINDESKKFGMRGFKSTEKKMMFVWASERWRILSGATERFIVRVLKKGGKKNNEKKSIKIEAV